MAATTVPSAAAAASTASAPLATIPSALPTAKPRCTHPSVSVATGPTSLPSAAGGAALSVSSALYPPYPPAQPGDLRLASIALAGGRSTAVQCTSWREYDYRTRRWEVTPPGSSPRVDCNTRSYRYGMHYVQVFHEGVWGAVMNSDSEPWTLDARHWGYDAGTPETVCRQLGYDRVCNAGTLTGKCLPCERIYSGRCDTNCSDAWHALMPNVVRWLDGVRCVGNESRLVDCPHAGWGHTLREVQTRWTSGRKSRNGGPYSLGIPLVSCCSSIPLPPPFPPPLPSNPCRNRWGEVRPCDDPPPPPRKASFPVLNMVLSAVSVMMTVCITIVLTLCSAGNDCHCAWVERQRAAQSRVNLVPSTQARSDVADKFRRADASSGIALQGHNPVEKVSLHGRNTVEKIRDPIYPPTHPPRRNAPVGIFTQHHLPSKDPSAIRRVPPSSSGAHLSTVGPAPNTVVGTVVGTAIPAPLQCPQCGKLLKTAVGLAAHMQAKHGSPLNLPSTAEGRSAAASLIARSWRCRTSTGSSLKMGTPVVLVNSEDAPLGVAV